MFLFQLIRVLLISITFYTYLAKVCSINVWEACPTFNALLCKRTDWISQWAVYMNIHNTNIT